MTLEIEKILAKNDTILKKITLQTPKPVIESTNDVFHDLMGCIIEQQIHFRSTLTFITIKLNKREQTILTL